MFERIHEIEKPFKHEEREVIYKTEKSHGEYFKTIEPISITPEFCTPTSKIEEKDEKSPRKNLKRILKKNHS